MVNDDTPDNKKEADSIDEHFRQLLASLHRQQLQATLALAMTSKEAEKIEEQGSQQVTSTAITLTP